MSTPEARVAGLSSKAVLELLAENPKRIGEITSRLSATQLHAAPGPEEWSANDVLAHIRCCADVWGTGLRTILAKDRPTIRAVSPRGWIKRTAYLDLAFAVSWKEFVEQRAELIALLHPLTPNDWSRTATLKASGKTTIWTLLSYAGRLANHEHHHISQFERIAGDV